MPSIEAVGRFVTASGHHYWVSKDGFTQRKKNDSPDQSFHDATNQSVLEDDPLFFPPSELTLYLDKSEALKVHVHLKQKFYDPSILITKEGIYMTMKKPDGSFQRLGDSLHFTETPAFGRSPLECWELIKEDDMAVPKKFILGKAIILLDQTTIANEPKS